VWGVCGVWVCVGGGCGVCVVGVWGGVWCVCVCGVVCVWCVCVCGVCVCVCVCVKFCCKLVKNFRETFHLLNQAYGEDDMSPTQGYEWFKRSKKRP